MDGEIPSGEPASGPDDDGDKPRRGAAVAARKPPTWASAIPAYVDEADQLEVVATLGFNALKVALERVLIEKMIKPEKRIALIVQLTAQMSGAVAKRRLWEAEQVIKAEHSGMDRPTTGPKMEARSDVDANGSSSGQQAGRPTARRGRPRAR